MTTYFAERAWLPDGPAEAVRIVVEDGRFHSVTVGEPPQNGDERLDGFVLPGLANTHSHAFHRALRGRTANDTGSFWTWRERMYEVAARLDPASYHRLARAVFAEMTLAGITTVGEFHYLHHRPDGTRYPDENAMGRAVIRAAAEAGIRLTLLDSCYLSGGLREGKSQPIEPKQRAFSDGDVESWAARVARLRESSDARVGVAIHSVRAVPRTAISTVVQLAGDGPLHVHLSEQVAENEQSFAAYGVTPSQLLAELGALGPGTTAVHATHLSQADIALLGSTATSISVCPTTERDLADGIGESMALARVGCPLTLGTDQNVVIDLFEEARALEMHERLRTRSRGHFTTTALVNSLTRAGNLSLGWTDAGAISVGFRADLVTIRLDSVRTAGAAPEQAIAAATAADVEFVMRDGYVVVENGRHVLGDIGALLSAEISALW